MGRCAALLALSFCSLVVLAICSHADHPNDIEVLAHYPYKENFVYTVHECDYTSEPCARLNDIWGYEFQQDGKNRSYAIVGLANGIDFVDVTDPTNPEHVKWIPGCINIWRDMKVWGKYVYGISEYTPTCNCPNVNGSAGKCQEHMNVTAPASIAGAYPSEEGRLTIPLPPEGITGKLVAVEPWENKACDVIENAAEVSGNIALIPFDNVCSFKDKVTNAQAAGAKAVVIVFDADAAIYPGMTGSPDGVNISGVLVGYTDGNKFKAALDDGETVEVLLTPENKQANPLFGAPEGLTIISMEDPTNPNLVARRTDQFFFAHNLFIEFDRPYLYTCGMSDRQEGPPGFGDLSNGGVFSYDVSEDAENPKFLAQWNESYVHDLMVQQCDGDYIMFTAAIYDDYVYVFNVTDPSNFQELLRFHGRQGLAHNIWVDKTCSVMYLTHEANNEPVTVWTLWKDSQGKILWNQQPKYRGSLSINQFNGTLPHNVFVRDDTLWAAYYSEGVAAWDITDPANPVMDAHFDTSPYTGGTNGVWGVYPFTSDGTVYASDITEGLFVVKLSTSTDGNDGNDGNDGGDGGGGDDDKDWYETHWKIATGFAVLFGLITALLIGFIIAGVVFVIAAKKGLIEKFTTHSYTTL